MMVVYSMVLAKQTIANCSEKNAEQKNMKFSSTLRTTFTYWNWDRLDSIIHQFRRCRKKSLALATISLPNMESLWLQKKYTW